MIYQLENNCWILSNTENTDNDKQAAALFRIDETEQINAFLPINHELAKSSLANLSFSFDRSENIDYMGFLYLQQDELSGTNEKMIICETTGKLLFLHSGADHMTSVLAQILSDVNEEKKGLGLLLCSFMEKMVAGHIKTHEIIEDQISSLEKSFLTSEKKQGPGEILILRKNLITFKRYYEQLQNILDDIQENEYNLIDEHTMRYFSVFTRRIERLYQNILILRDYVTQVRESYEAETDLKLNNIMRIFTVVTVIFLPLTLIAGWYGMNLKMPEYQWAWSYPAVLAVSIFVVVFSVVYFKKNKWF
jgi:magnesium transporter